MTPLYPPLPPPLSHTGIVFIFDKSGVSSKQGEPDSDEILALIAVGLTDLLPEGDLAVNHNGELVPLGPNGPSNTSSSSPTLWYQAGLLAGIERL
jgi:hypothetical protein